MEPPPPTKRLWKLNNLYRLCLKTFEGNKGILDLRGQDQGWQANVVRYILVCHCSDFFIEFLLHFSFANLLSKTAHRSSLEHASILIIYGGKNWGAREVWQPELEEQKEQLRFSMAIFQGDTSQFMTAPCPTPIFVIQNSHPFLLYHSALRQ